VRDGSSAEPFGVYGCRSEPTMDRASAAASSSRRRYARDVRFGPELRAVLICTRRTTSRTTSRISHTSRIS
jgi:hypothetical protein